MLPTFLWMGNPPGHDFNEDDMLNGLFRGYLPLQVHSELAISICFDCDHLGCKTYLQRAIHSTGGEATQTSSMQRSFVWHYNDQARTYCIYLYAGKLL